MDVVEALDLKPSPRSWAPHLLRKCLGGPREGADGVWPDGRGPEERGGTSERLPPAARTPSDPASQGHLPQLRGGGFVAVLALVLGLVSAPAFADCVALDNRIKAAIGAGDTASLPALADAVAVDTSCASDYVANARRNIALAIMLKGEQPDGSYAEEAVRSAAAIARPWQVAMALGDLDYDGKAYKAAVEAYEAAINDIRDVKAVPVAPARDVEEYLARRAYQAKSLAPGYIASRGFRGEPEGLMVPAFRNFTAVSVPVPIRFEIDKATLTPDGERAVDDLYNFLKTQSATAVTLIGHTDETGTPQHNLILSRERAMTVAAALQARGLHLDIRAEGRGEKEPFEADDRSKYSRDELYSFDRRVEYQMN